MVFSRKQNVFSRIFSYKFPRGFKSFTDFSARECRNESLSHLCHQAIICGKFVLSPGSTYYSMNTLPGNPCLLGRNERMSKQFWSLTRLIGRPRFVQIIFGKPGNHGDAYVY